MQRRPCDADGTAAGLFNSSTTSGDIMHRNAVVALAVVTTLACAERPEPTAPIMLTVYGDAAALSENSNGGNFGTPLSPKNEVMPAGVVNTSKAVGNAIFQLNADGTELSYKLIVANINNVVQAHIHIGAAGTNGGIIVWLYPNTTGPAVAGGGGRIQGVIAQGTITSANLIGALAGQEVSDLVALIEADGAYVNVHTNDGVNPPNTGPGDYPGGELRGQLGHRGH